MQNLKKYCLSFVAIVLVALFSYSIMATPVAEASITTGSILMNYDNNGGADPDCVGVLNNNNYVKWGDNKGSGGSPAAGQFTFCLNSAVKYASGLSDISNLKITYEKISRLPVSGLSGEDNKTYVSYRISFEPKPVVTPPVTPEDPTLIGDCSVNPTSVNINGYLNWSATASGGNKSYAYSWKDETGAIIGTGKSISKLYTTAGQKTGIVTITSGTQTFTKSCSATVVTPQDQTLTGSCSVSPSSVTVNGYLNWSVSGVSGGDGNYSYSWKDESGAVIGTGSQFSKSYSTTGTKTGIVTITSGSQSVSKTCSATVVSQTIIDDDDSDLSIYCRASQSSVDIDEDITWRAYASGGNGNYDYDWDGTDDLSGSNRTLVWSYDDNGTKRATVTVWSNGQSETASCSTRVNDNNDDEDLSVSCYASPTSVQTGNRMNWYADVSGGDGDYDYSWRGTDGLNSSSRSPYMTYDSTGSKSATITVRDGDGNRDSDTCYVNVNAVLGFTQTYQPPLASAVYLSQVPYTGIADNYKLYFFIGLLALFSAWIAYIIIERKKTLGELN